MTIDFTKLSAFLARFGFRMKFIFLSKPIAGVFEDIRLPVEMRIERIK